MTVETTLNMTSMNAALKELYDGQKVSKMAYRKNPFLAMVPKNTKSGGKYIPVPVQYGVSQGRSATFAYAQTQQTAPALAEFLVTLKSDYSIATIDNRTLESSKGDAEAFISAASLHIDSAIHAASLSLASGLFRNGSGNIGQMTSISTGVIVLKDPTTVTQFEVNQTLQADDLATGASPLAALGYVISVNRGAGTITVSDSLGGAAATPTSWTTDYYLFTYGDIGAKVSGISAWVPASAPAATSFYGVDRSVDARLGGLRWDGSAQSIEEALIDASNLGAREGANITDCFTNYVSYSALVKSLGSKVQYVDLESPAGIAFRGIRLHGDDGEINVIPDRNCQGSTAYLLDMESWCLRTIGDAPRILTYGKEGLEMLRVYNADAAEVRVGYYGNLVCTRPGSNVNVTLGA